MAPRSQKPRRAPLRAVEPGETARKQPRRKLSVSEAAASGDRLALLVAMRDVVAAAVANPTIHPRDLGVLTRRLSEMGREIAEIEAAVDEADGTGAIVRTPDEPWTAV